ncbi:MAG: peptidoglycan DD-metalloendopeptidase family protein [Pleurocapsa sp.]
MSYKNDLISPQAHSNANSNDTVKLANQRACKLGMTISLAAAICVPNFNQAVNATDLTKSVTPNSFSTTNQDIANSFQRQGKFPYLLPNIFSQITSSVKSQLVNLSRLPIASEDKYARSTDPIFAVDNLKKVKQATNLTNLFLTSSYFKTAKSEQLIISALDSSVIKPQHHIHQIVQGDTINKIAKKYQVSKNDLVKLNKIKNSNIIFVNQQLKIPTQTTTNIQPATSLASANLLQDTTQQVKSSSGSTNVLVKLAEEAAAAKSLKTNQAELNSVTDNNPYVEKLRAEVDLLRAQHRNKNKSGEEPNQRSSLVNLPLAPNFEDTHQLLGNFPKASESRIKANSTLAQPNLSSSLLNKATVSLKLPPLPAAEEYLPPTFDGYMWPAQGVLTSGYGWRWGRLHQGIDIAGPIGTPILAAATGVVVGAGWHGGYGNVVKLEHPNGSITLYAHNNSILVTHGQQVNQGEQIAEMGSTGNSTGSHLHFEIHDKDSGIVNPLALLSSQ